MPGSPTHLILRFADVATARPLGASEREAVSVWLSEGLAGVFFDQPEPDQRHGYQAALSVIAGGHDDPDVIAAALLHDIGKRHAQLGLLGRSLASLLIILGLPLSQRMTAYRDHGVVGAGELVQMGAPSLAIDFALHHHGGRPSTIPAEIWDALVAADQPPKTVALASGWISSGTT